MAERHRHYRRHIADSGSDGRPRVSASACLIAGIVLMASVGTLSGCNTGSGTADGSTSATTAQKRTDVDWVTQKAKETGGDFNKLSPEDQRRMTSLHGSQAPNVLRGIASPPKDNF